MRNTIHPQLYNVRPGNGSCYTYIDSVEIKADKVEIVISVPGSINQLVKISDPEIIKVLPSLLGGEISCCEALHQLKRFLKDKHKEKLAALNVSFWKQSESDPEFKTVKSRMYHLCWDLVTWAKEDFAILCQFFPHEYAQRLECIQDTPVKCVNGEIINAIKENFPDIFGVNYRPNGAIPVAA